MEEFRNFVSQLQIKYSNNDNISFLEGTLCFQEQELCQKVATVLNS